MATVVILMQKIALHIICQEGKRLVSLQVPLLTSETERYRDTTCINMGHYLKVRKEKVIKEFGHLTSVRLSYWNENLLR